MIDIKQVLQAVPEEELKKIEKALLDGADATQLKELLAAQGVELDENEISEVSNGIIAKIANDPEVGIPLSDEELSQVAGGDALDWVGAHLPKCKG